MARHLVTSQLPKFQYMLRNDVLKLNTHVKDLQYISDIHLEGRVNVPQIPVLSNNLVVAGDIGDPFKNNYNDFMSKCSDNYENTFIISGNHEYWNDGICMTIVNQKIENIVSRYQNVHWLKNRIVETSDTVFIGAVLWSNIIIKQLANRGDALNITYADGPIGESQLNLLHKYDVDWLNSTINEIQNDKKLIVVTHHLPTYDLIHPKFQTFRWSGVLDRYASHNDRMIKPPVTAWLCGHSHHNMQIIKNGVYLGVNAMGYQGREAPMSDIMRGLINF
jgi:predicted phosphohydrolase